MDNIRYGTSLQIPEDESRIPRGADDNGELPEMSAGCALEIGWNPKIKRIYGLKIGKDHQRSPIDCSRFGPALSFSRARRLSLEGPGPEASDPESREATKSRCGSRDVGRNTTT